MMRLPPFRYLAPRTAAEAARMLADNGPEAMAVAGGTDLFPNMKRRQFTPTVLVSLRGLPHAARISANGGLTLGAMATLRARYESLTSSYNPVAVPAVSNARSFETVRTPVIRTSIKVTIGAFTGVKEGASMVAGSSVKSNTAASYSRPSSR